MPMIMMLCSSFNGSNTRGVTSFPPIKESRPEIKSLGQVMEKETRHSCISLFLVQDRGGMGFIPLITANVHILQLTRS
jgi:hypothetical protein